MTATDRFDALFADALHDLAAPQYPEYFDDALARAVRGAQRPRWTFPERLLPMSTVTGRTVFAPMIPWRQVGLLLAVLALIIAAAAVAIIGSQPVNPAPPFGPAGNGKVTYAADGDLFTRTVDGGVAQKIVGDAAYDVFPFFSRDGASLAFIRLDADPTDPANEVTTESLFVANADGTEVRSLLTADVIHASAWSASGSELAVINETDGVRRLSIVGVDGGTPRTIPLSVKPFDNLEWRPPDGRELIFRAQDGASYAIYAVRPDGSGLRKISTNQDIDTFWGPYAMAPDGSRLAYTEGRQLVRIRMLDLDTGADTVWGGELPRFGATGVEHWGFPAFSPDGTKVAFGRYWDERGDTLNHQVFVASVRGNGADAVAVAPLQRSKGGNNPFEYSFAPDGTKVVIYYHDELEAYLANPARIEMRKLDWGKVGDPPSWQRLAN